MHLAPPGFVRHRPYRSPESLNLSFPIWPVGALLGSLVSLSIGTSFAKSLFPAIGAGGTTLYRLVFATLILMALWRPWRRHWTWADALPLGLYGVTLGVMNLLFYNAIKTIPFGLAIAIEFTGPLAVALWHSRRANDLVWVVLAMLGLGMILPMPGAHDALNPLGIGFALAAGACWAMYIVFGQRVAQRYGTMATPMGMLAAALVVTPFGLYEAGSALLDTQWLAAGLAVALLSSAVPYTLEMVALKHLPKNTFSILLSLEPAVGAVAGWIVLGERLSPGQWAAMGFIITASMGSAWSAGHRGTNLSQ
ncbi:MAG: EamA family transporter [Limnohabitans sp.]